MDLADKKVAVIGVGKTGLATARFLAGRGARIALTDKKPVAEWGDILGALKTLGADLTVAPYGTEVLAGAELVVPSPGVYPSNPILQEALRRKIPIVSELELAFRFLATPLVAITGTNGKTTVTTLIGEILAAAGKKVFVGGNIGTPLIGYVDGPQDADWAVVEVSTFQLQWASTFHPRIGHPAQHHLRSYRLSRELRGLPADQGVDLRPPGRGRRRHPQRRREVDRGAPRTPARPDGALQLPGRRRARDVRRRGKTSPHLPAEASARNTPSG